MLLGKQQILDAQDRRHEDIAVPEWGGNVRVAMMSASDRDRWEQETYGGDTPKVDDFRARFVGLCLVDEMGGACSPTMRWPSWAQNRRRRWIACSGSRRRSMRSAMRPWESWKKTDPPA